MKNFIVANIMICIMSGVITQAQAQVESGMYLGVNAVLESDFEFAGEVNDQQEKGSGFNIGLGYVYSDVVSFELAYTEANNYENEVVGTSKVDIWELDMLVHQRFDDMALAPFVRLGFYQANSQEDTMFNRNKMTDEGVLYAIGLDYNFDRHRAVRIDYTPGSTDGDNDGLNRIMVGLIVHLGDD